LASAAEALVRVLNALEQTRKAFRAARDDPEGREHIQRADEALNQAADVLRSRLAPAERQAADESYELRRVDY
jgi:hypothetical protein